MVVDAKTKVGLFSVIAVVPTLIALVVWAVRVEAKVDSANKEIVRHEREIVEQSKMFVEIRERLIRIETNQHHGRK